MRLSNNSGIGNRNHLMATTIKHQENQLHQYVGDILVFIVIQSILVLHDGKNMRCGMESKILYIYGMIRFFNQRNSQYQAQNKI